MINDSNHIDDELLVRFLAEETSPQEVLEVNGWINSSPENRKYFDEFKEVWNAQEALKDFESINAEEDWRKVKSKISFDAHDNVRSLKVEKGFFYYATRVAAAIVLLAGIGWLVTTYSKTEEIVVVAKDVKQEVILPDGSKVILNRGAQIVYLEDFKENRTLTLIGEAYFQVKRNPKYPFKVMARQSVTEVLGTSFNVNAETKNSETVVTVFSGKVAFYNVENEKERVEMVVGEQGILEKGVVSKKANKDLNVTSWKDDKLVFEDAHLSEVIQTLEEYFEVDIKTDNDSLLNCRYTGAFTQPELEKIFKVIEYSLDAKVTKQGDKFILNGEGCQ